MYLPGLTKVIAPRALRSSGAVLSRESTCLLRAGTAVIGGALVGTGTTFSIFKFALRVVTGAPGC